MIYFQVFFFFSDIKCFQVLMIGYSRCKRCSILGFVSFIRYNIVHPAVDLPKCVLWDIVNFLMHPVRHVIEDDHSLDRINVKNLGLMSSSEASMVDSAMTDSELSLVSGIMFEQHDKLTEHMDTVEKTVGQYLRVHIGNPLASKASV